MHKHTNELEILHRLKYLFGVGNVRTEKIGKHYPPAAGGGGK